MKKAILLRVKTFSLSRIIRPSANGAFGLKYILGKLFKGTVPLK